MYPRGKCAHYILPAPAGCACCSGCDLEPRCQSGETPLVKAARAQAMRAYKFLLEHGTPHAEIEHRNREDDNARQLIIDNTRHWHISGGASVEYTK